MQTDSKINKLFSNCEFYQNHSFVIDKLYEIDRSSFWYGSPADELVIRGWSYVLYVLVVEMPCMSQSIWFDMLVAYTNRDSGCPAGEDIGCELFENSSFCADNYFVINYCEMFLCLSLLFFAPAVFADL